MNFRIESRLCFSALYVGAVECWVTIVYDGEPFKVTSSLKTTHHSCNFILMSWKFVILWELSKATKKGCQPMQGALNGVPACDTS